MKEWKHKCELQLLVCEPNPLRPDRVTVGFVLRDLLSDPPRIEVRFARNLRALRCIYPDADVEAIQGALLEQEHLLKQVTDIEKHFEYLPGDFPAHFEFLSSTAVLTDSIEKELPLLEGQYLATLRGTRAGEESEKEKQEEQYEIGRPYLRRRMQEELGLVVSSGLMATEILVNQYTFQGDPLKIDFGYKRDSGYRMLHATSVVTGLEETAILAVKWKGIREGIAKSFVSRCELLTIIEDSPFTQSEQSRAAQKWLMDEGIEMRPVSEMAAVAEDIRLDLKL